MFTRKQIWRRIKPRIRSDHKTKKQSDTTNDNDKEIIENKEEDDKNCKIDNECLEIFNNVNKFSNHVNDNSNCNDSLPHNEKHKKEVHIQEYDNDQEQKNDENINSPTIRINLTRKCVPITKRNVSFNNLVRVCLVPSRCEYSPMTQELYWSPEDYAFFKQDAVAELREYWRRNQTTVKEAIAALYQPREEDITESSSIPFTPSNSVNKLTPYGTTTIKHNDSVASLNNLPSNLQEIIQKEVGIDEDTIDDNEESDFEVGEGLMLSPDSSVHGEVNGGNSNIAVALSEGHVNSSELIPNDYGSDEYSVFADEEMITRPITPGLTNTIQYSHRNNNDSGYNILDVSDDDESHTDGEESSYCSTATLTSITTNNSNCSIKNKTSVSRYSQYNYCDKSKCETINESIDSAYNNSSESVPLIDPNNNSIITT